MVEEIEIDDEDSFQFGFRLPVVEANYGGALRWHPKAKVGGGCTLIRFSGKLWQPLMSVQESTAEEKRLIICAHEVGRPLLCIQLIDFEPQSPAVGLMILLAFLDHCRVINSKLCMWLARSNRLQRMRSTPSMAFLRTVSRWSSPIIKEYFAFPPKDIAAVRVSRFVQYVGAAPQLSIRHLSTDEELESWMKSTSFGSSETFALDAPQLSELANAADRFATQYPHDFWDTSHLYGAQNTLYAQGREKTAGRMVKTDQSQEENPEHETGLGLSSVLPTIEETDE